jgi:hypothetical protein
MDIAIHEEIFKQFNLILSEYGVYKPQDIFRLLNEFQSNHLDNIEKANTELHQVALMRTSDYHSFETLKKFKKSKSKKKILFKLVNLFVIDIISIEYINSSGWAKETFDELVNHKDDILSNRDWYLRIIPESKWFIEYLESM